MRLSLSLLFSVFYASSLFGAFPLELKTKILFFMHHGQSNKALECYLAYAKESQTQDFELLEKASLALIEQGMKSDDAEIRLLSLYGAGISLNKEVLSILSSGLESNDLRMQMIALSFLDKFHDDEALEIVRKALSSQSLLPRLEAAYILAKAGSIDIVDQLLSLYEKVPDKARPLIAEIVSKCEGEGANLMMKRLLNDPVTEVRLATILEIGETQREELLSKVRSMATMGNFREEECAAAVLGELKDSNSKAKLWQIATRKCQTTRLAGLNALAKLNEEGVYEKIHNEDSPFAIALYSKGNDSLPFLERALETPDFSLKVNAALALLERGKMPPISLLRDMLISDSRDFGFIREHSPGTTLTYWKAIANKKEQEDRYPRILSETSRFKQKVLNEATKLSEEQFFKIITLVIESQDTAIYLPAAQLLIENSSESARQLLKTMREKAGAPFARLVANLALFEMTKESIYENELISWLKQTVEQPLIRFKKEESVAKLRSPFLLTPEETSEILIITFESLAHTRNPAAIEALLHAMAYGNPKNRYALAGLLIKATE